MPQPSELSSALLLNDDLWRIQLVTALSANSIPCAISSRPDSECITSAGYRDRTIRNPVKKHLRLSAGLFENLWESRQFI
jgi:hypothetical protein